MQGRNVITLSMKIKDLPEAERPYEKLELYGEKCLSNAELLAIIIKSGTKEETSVQIAQKILKLREEDGEEDDLNFLKTIGLAQLQQIKGIGKVKAIQLKAVCELANRMSKPANYKGIKIRTPQDISDMVGDELRHEKREIARAFLLNNKNRILKVQDIATGGPNFVEFNIRDIASIAVKIGATRVILVHNHPTGESKPSDADLQYTAKLYYALEFFEVDLLDHVIIANEGYTSIYEYVQKMQNENPDKIKEILKGLKLK